MVSAQAAQVENCCKRMLAVGVILVAVCVAAARVVAGEGALLARYAPGFVMWLDGRVGEPATVALLLPLFVVPGFVAIVGAGLHRRLCEAVTGR